MRKQECSTWNKIGSRKKNVPRGTFKQMLFSGSKKTRFLILLLTVSRFLSAESLVTEISEPATPDTVCSFLKTVIFEEKIPVFLFKKQYDVFKSEPDIGTVQKGFSLFLSVQKDSRIFLEEETALRKEQKEKEELFKKEKNRLEEIYSRKLLPLEEALNVWKKQPKNREAETDSLKQKISELKNLRDREISAEKKRIFPGPEKTNFNLSAEEAVRERLIEKYRFSRFSLSGTDLSLSDVFGSVIMTAVEISEIPMKSLDVEFSEDEDGKKRTIRSCLPDYRKPGLNFSVPEFSQNFRFDKSYFESMLSNLLSSDFSAFDGKNCADGTQNFPDVQIVSYRIDLVRMASKEREIRKRKNSEKLFDFPVGLHLNKIGIETGLFSDEGKDYFLILPKKQRGTIAEQLCLILPVDTARLLLASLRETKKTLTEIKTDFLTFDNEIPTEYFYITDGSVTVLQEAVTEKKNRTK